VLPLQQPFGHEVTSQTHCPLVLLHSWPDAHAEQLAPATPHEPFDSEAYATHVVPLQHPPGHEVASHTHCPELLLHSSPEPQASHAPPPAPHERLDSLDSASHVDPLQQPAHDPPPHAHAPLVHMSPVPQGPQLAPSEPHSLGDCAAYKTQVLPLQQPVGQELELQTHCPVVWLHAWPDAQAEQLAPPVPHEGVDSEAWASQVPVTPPLQQPFGHVVASQEQAPVVVSQSPFTHDVHAAPPLPHIPGDSDG